MLAQGRLTCVQTSPIKEKAARRLSEGNINAKKWS